ncbi:hypothetical protein D3C87_1554770 [compost metagenome]
MAKYQLGGQQALGDQALRTIEVRQHGIEQASPLRDARRQLLPLIGRNDMGQQVQLPRPISPLGVGVDVVGHAVFLDLSGQQRLTLHQLRWRAALQLAEQPLPVRAHGATVIKQFVVGARRQRVAVKQIRHGKLGRQQGTVRLTQAHDARTYEQSERRVQFRNVANRASSVARR